MSERLKDKVALITGGAQGLGKEMAKSMLAESAHVIIADINEAKLVEAAKELSCSHLILDVTNEEQWQSVIKQITDDTASLNILVNNAGIGFISDVESTSEEDWELVHKVDLDSVFLGCKYALPLMRKSGNGSIINISSISGIVAGHNFAAYNSAKAGVRHLSKSVALHCARTTDLVRCNSIHPVFAKTEMMQAFFENASEELLGKLEKQIPIRKFAESIDVANGILFLASDESKMITGTELVIDGGLSAQ